MAISQCFQELAKPFFVNMDTECPLLCCLDVHISEAPGSGQGAVGQGSAEDLGLQHLSSGLFLREDIKADTEAGDPAKRYRPWPRGPRPRDHTPGAVGAGEPAGSARRLAIFPGPQFRLKPWMGSVPWLGDHSEHRIPHRKHPDDPSRGWARPLAEGCITCTSIHLSYLGDDVTGGRWVQQEDATPEAVNVRLSQHQEVANPVVKLCKTQGVRPQFSGTETDQICPCVYTVFSNKITPIQSRGAR
ncbi:adenylate kinase 4, mitochondrial-like [Myotis lucifugus]|uniref:adenylate kinase 4, mitochondrial-like n=1 Tax=Myotis lucifugus TaxID=59463 RepID=UPI0003C4A861|nr:adenylate kinase 4, mitochondrial-like [Myotis lucifugus]